MCRLLESCFASSASKSGQLCSSGRMGWTMEDCLSASRIYIQLFLVLLMQLDWLRMSMGSTVCTGRNWWAGALLRRSSAQEPFGSGSLATNLSPKLMTSATSEGHVMESYCDRVIPPESVWICLDSTPHWIFELGLVQATLGLRAHMGVVRSKCYSIPS